MTTLKMLFLAPVAAIGLAACSSSGAPLVNINVGGGQPGVVVGGMVGRHAPVEERICVDRRSGRVITCPPQRRPVHVRQQRNYPFQGEYHRTRRSAPPWCEQHRRRHRH